MEIFGHEGATFRLSHVSTTQDPCRGKFSRRSRRWRLDHDTSVAARSVGPCTEGVRRTFEGLGGLGP